MTNRDWNAAIEADLLPCPWPHESKRGVDYEIDREDFGFVRVVCCDCGVAGPYVNIDIDPTPGELAKAKAEAHRLWNTRQPTTPTTGEDDVERAIGLTLDQVSSSLLGTAEDMRRHSGDAAAAALEGVAESIDERRAKMVSDIRAALAAISPTTEDAGPTLAGVQRQVERLIADNPNEGLKISDWVARRMESAALAAISPTTEDAERFCGHERMRKALADEMREEGQVQMVLTATPLGYSAAWFCHDELAAVRAEKRELVEALRGLIDECSIKLGDPRGVSIYAIENARKALASIGERS